MLLRYTLVILKLITKLTLGNSYRAALVVL